MSYPILTWMSILVGWVLIPALAVLTTVFFGWWYGTGRHITFGEDES
ncbi:MAG: hypothetical protein AB7P24_12225 [Nitrospira sp.]